MSNQFKTFLKFAGLAVIIIIIPIISDLLGKNIIEWFFLPAVVIFLFLIWRKLSPKLKSKNPVAENIPAIISWQRQLISSLILSIVVFLGFAMLVFILMPVLVDLAVFIANIIGGVITNIILQILLIPFLIIIIARWISTIKHSILVRSDDFARKSAEKRIIKLSLAIGVVVLIEIGLFFGNMVFGLIGL